MHCIHFSKLIEAGEPPDWLEPCLVAAFDTVSRTDGGYTAAVRPEGWALPPIQRLQSLKSWCHDAMIFLQDGQPVAVVFWNRDFYQQRAVIHHVWVQPKLRRQGLGLNAVLECFAHVRQDRAMPCALLGLVSTRFGQSVLARLRNRESQLRLTLVHGRLEVHFKS